MSGLLYKFLLQKTGLAGVIKIGDEDPYMELIPEDELKFYQKSGAKRKRKVPTFLSAQDQKVLRSVRNRAHSLDLAFSICSVRVGWSGIIGLIPGIGDIIACLLAVLLVRKASKIEGGLPDLVKAKMMSNVAMDFGIGLIPFVGDFINIAYKANTRNFQILERYLYEKYAKLNMIPREHKVPSFAHLDVNAPAPQQRVRLQEIPN